ncbi:MAG: hypothetical protein EXR71_17835 [Myxococcales bacterium]|nr:hypothetical protein [Myxococcales bacterium]
MWPLFIFGACGGSLAPDFAGGGERGDPVGGAGSTGDDTDVTETGDADTGGDTDEAVCDALDLEMRVVVEDAAGQQATAFSWPVQITARALFVNPCDGTLRFDTPTSCLVDTWTLAAGSGDDSSFSGNCVPGETTWTLEVGEGTSVVVDWGILDEDTYQVSARSDAAQTTASEFFSVQ